jgi:hypothetical protein
MNERDWLTAWRLFERGWTMAQIEAHFHVGHTTVSKGFARRGWYCRKSKATLPAAPSEKPQAVRGKAGKQHSSAWTPTQAFLAAFLGEKGRPSEYIADVVNQPVDAVKELLAA